MMYTTKDNKQIKLGFLVGVSDLGKPIFKSRSYKNVDSEFATLDNVQAFGDALAVLSELPLDRVILATESEVIRM
ncbi:hypothetical protein BEP19_09290 [Ammoniphilus oxalaticus]|uniref:DUF1659 domain-containing protein n=1 Tax=Ammoniphilus oxalaticus TaxID=66863 RepID=A0A419SKM9_9BACL|nr:DUF1659 domain-containing protein [Ammoniphilus oxalaticus]RKD24563.1 hypothetical protein BEP19_09290 [Ammoniphilus oxalaticus]